MEAASMAIMGMGKASALLICRIVFKLFHSKSNSHFFFLWLADDVEVCGENEEQFEDAEKWVSYQLHNLGHKLKSTVETLFVVDK